jgi:ATP-dependent DNA helicase RecG
MLDLPVEYIKGVGPQRAQVLKSELGILVARDLLQHYPFRYVDRTRLHQLSEINEEMPYVHLKGQVKSLEIVGQKNGKRLVVQFLTESGIIELVWFKGYHWVAQKIKMGVVYVVLGKVNVFNGKYSLPHPDMDEFTDAFSHDLTAFQPVYSSTEKLKYKGLDSEGIRKIIRGLLVQPAFDLIPEILPKSVRDNNRLMGLTEAWRKIHFPQNKSDLDAAMQRIKFDELFFIQVRLLRLHHNRAKTINGYVFSKVGNAFNDFYQNHLPYTLTNAQKKVLKEIRADLGSGKQMNRLLQGDVGSGKTLVALMSMLLAIDNGYQACLMAPTEILAQQHFASFKDFLQNQAFEMALLTGSTRTKERKQIHQKLLSGDLKIVIGTHALIEDVVQFQNLGLVVIDEQHRFGVEQRAKLGRKNTYPPHVLIMTATPIPRTLAMTFYGDLDTSVIDELPPGRKAIKTLHYFESHRLRVFGFLKEQIKLGRQVYVVYPLIQESEKMDYRNLQEGYDNLVLEFPPPDYQISIVHGKLSNEQKEFEMARFVKGETQMMVATTVIEVGVNVPNASVMVIESAERFGLSQLHQLRGRVGRGADQSYCILMTGYKLGADTKLRMETMVRTNDGFEISEVDLKLRGPGNIEGTQQSGVTDLKLSNLAKDGQILQLARNAAMLVLAEDEALQSEENKCLVTHLQNQYMNKTNWSKIG